MNRTEDILIKYLSGNCSPEEISEVQQLLADSEEAKAQYASLAQVFELTENIHYPDSEVEMAWQEFEANVKAPNKTLGFDWLKVAASIVLLAAFSVAIFSYLQKGNSYTTKNDPLNLELVDHSSIVLNEGTILTANRGFNKDHRQVVLEGEAFFKVAPAEHAFKISVLGGDIEVTGTSFNVMNHPDQEFLSIELYEGSVNYSNAQKSYKLTAGQRLEYINGEVIVTSLSSELPYWYNTEEINCNDVSLLEIMLQIEQIYQVKFKLPKRKLKERYTVALPKDDLTTCLKLISEISDTNLKLKGDLITAQ